MLDELRRVAMFTSGVAELTRYRAEQIVKDLVNAGDVRREQASSIVRELLETSKTSRQELVRFVRTEIQSQVGALGLADRRELERLERRVARLEAGGIPKAASSSASSGGNLGSQGGRTKSTAKKSTAKKSTAKKSTAKKSTAGKSMSSKSTSGGSASS